MLFTFMSRAKSGPGTDHPVLDLLKLNRYVAMSGIPSEPLSTVSPTQEPLTPEPVDNRRISVHASPSFDYHEERRRHLNDEIWLSHHLPRLPPSSIPAEASSSSRPSGEGLAVNAAVQVEKSARLDDRARYTRPSTIGRPEDTDGEMGLGIGVGGNLQNGGAGMATGSISAAGGDDTDERTPDDPSGMEDGALRPAQKMIHRAELDDQERLDLAAERRERIISEGRHDLGVASTGLESADGAGPARDVKAAKGIEAGEYLIAAFGMRPLCITTFYLQLPVRRCFLPLSS